MPEPTTTPQPNLTELTGKIDAFLKSPKYLQAPPEKQANYKAKIYRKYIKPAQAEIFKGDPVAEALAQKSNGLYSVFSERFSAEEAGISKSLGNFFEWQVGQMDRDAARKEGRTLSSLIAKPEDHSPAKVMNMAAAKFFREKQALYEAKEMSYAGHFQKILRKQHRGRTMLERIAGMTGETIPQLPAFEAAGGVVGKLPYLDEAYIATKGKLAQFGLKRASEALSGYLAGNFTGSEHPELDAVAFSAFGAAGAGISGGLRALGKLIGFGGTSVVKTAVENVVKETAEKAEVANVHPHVVAEEGNFKQKVNATTRQMLVMGGKTFDEMSEKEQKVAVRRLARLGKEAADQTAVINPEITKVTIRASLKKTYEKNPIQGAVAKQIEKVSGVKAEDAAAEIVAKAQKDVAIQKAAKAKAKGIKPEVVEDDEPHNMYAEVKAGSDFAPKADNRVATGATAKLVDKANKFNRANGFADLKFEDDATAAKRLLFTYQHLIHQYPNQKGAARVANTKLANQILEHLNRVLPELKGTKGILEASSHMWEHVAALNTTGEEARVFATTKIQGPPSKFQADILRRAAEKDPERHALAIERLKEHGLWEEPRPYFKAQLELQGLNQKEQLAFNPEEFLNTPEKLAAAKKQVDFSAKLFNYPEARITISPRRIKGEVESKLFTLGHYIPWEDRIQVFPDLFRFSEVEAHGVMAHEITHAKFARISRDMGPLGFGQLLKYVNPAHNAYNEELVKELSSTGAFTPYAKEWWDLFKTGDTTFRNAMNESLAEMAYLDAQGEFARVEKLPNKDVKVYGGEHPVERIIPYKWWRLYNLIKEVDVSKPLEGADD